MGLLMKVVAVFLATLIAVEGVTIHDHHHLHSPEHVHIRQTGVGYSQQNVVERPQPYSFAFEAENEYGARLSRQEAGDEAGVVRGNYGYTDPSGIYRHVDYIADADGFRATVRTNEPGTSSADPADVDMQAEPVQVVVDRPVHVARPHVDVAPAPVVHHAPAPVPHVDIVSQRPLARPHRIPDHLRIADALIQRARPRPRAVTTQHLHHADQHAHIAPIRHAAPTTHTHVAPAAVVHQDVQHPGAPLVHHDTQLGRAEVVHHAPAPIAVPHVDVAPRPVAVHRVGHHHTGTSAGGAVHQESQHPGGPLIHHDTQLGRRRTPVHIPTHTHVAPAPVVHHATEHIVPQRVVHEVAHRPVQHVAVGPPGLRVQATLPNGFSYSY